MYLAELIRVLGEAVYIFMFEEIRQREGGQRTGLSDRMALFVFTGKNMEHLLKQKSTGTIMCKSIRYHVDHSCLL